MKIVYFRVKNSKRLYNGLNGKTTLTIDFSQRVHKVCIFKGKNGSGKSSIVRMLHPFHNDIINNENIFREGKEGEKEIWYEHNGATYKIIHYAKPSGKSHTVKSYIKKCIGPEEIELNDNGGVNSFKDIIECEFELDPSFIKLLSLGITSGGFIDMTTGDRKAYITNLLSATELYVTYFKKVNKDLGEMKTLSTDLARRASKLESPEHIDSELDGIDTRLDEIKREHESLIAELNNAKGAKIAYDPDGEIESEYRNLKSGRNDIQLEIDRINNRIDMISGAIGRDVTGIKISEINEITSDFERSLTTANIKLANAQTAMKETMSNSQKLQESLEQEMIKSNEIRIDEDITELESIRESYLEKVNTFDTMFNGYSINISSNELMTVLEVIKDIEQYMSDFRGSYPYQAQQMLLEPSAESKASQNVQSLSNSLRSMEERLSNLTDSVSELAYGAKTSDILSNRPKDCKIDSCPFISDAIRWKDAKGKLEKKSTELDKLRQDMSQTRKDYEMYKDIIDASNQLAVIVRFIKSNSTLLNKIPNINIDMTDSGLKYFIIQGNVNLYQVAYEYLDVVQLYEEYVHISEVGLPKITNQIDKLRNKMDMINSIHEKISELENMIQDCEDKLQHYDAIVVEMTTEIMNYNKIITTMKSLYDLVTQLDESKKSFEVYSSQMEEIMDKITIIDDLNLKISQIETKISNLDRPLDGLGKRRDELIHMKALTISYRKEMDILEKNMLKTDVVSWALSPRKEGIPVTFAEMYLKDTRKLANRLLGLVFEGQMRLLKFQIDDTTFNMPVDTGGDIIPDASSLSDGQRAILALIWSFALMFQSSRVYNVICLDEMDAVLDVENREKFIAVLEEIMQLMGCEDLYIVSHNDAFESYPVDVVALPGAVIGSAMDKNIILDLR